METDSLLMDDVDVHLRSPRGMLSSRSSRRGVRESSDEELLDVNLSLPHAAESDDRPHGTYAIVITCWYLQTVFL